MGTRIEIQLTRDGERKSDSAGGYSGRAMLWCPSFGSTRETTSTGLVVIGSSGMGKTRTIDRILRLYPQVIRHTRYRRHDFLETQIVYLHVDCPHNGSLLALIVEIFGSIDTLAQTNHTANYVRGGRTAEAL